MVYDLLIVGSGATALYLAYQLRYYTSDNDFSAIMISADEHVGGRISSTTLANTVVDSCATRYYQKYMPLVSELAEELQVPGYLEPPVTVMTPTGDDIIARVLATYPPATTEHPELIPMNWAITNSSPNGFADVQRLALELGYQYWINNANLNIVYGSYPLSGEDENRFVGGFQSFMQAIYQQLTLPVVFGTTITKIENFRTCDGTDGGFLVHTCDQRQHYGNLRVRQIVYTGTIPQLSSLVLPPALQERASLLRTAFNVNSGARIYIHFANPWWQELLKYTGNPLFNQLIYYSADVLQLYMIGNSQAQLMEQVAAEHVGHVITPDRVPELMNQIYQQIPLIVGHEIPFEQLLSATSLIIYYSPVAVNTSVPGPLLPNNVRYGDGFHIVSGDTLDYDQGWVETSFRAVQLFLAGGYLPLPKAQSA